MLGIAKFAARSIILKERKENQKGRAIGIAKNVAKSIPEVT